METIPQEILVAIASALPSVTDIGNVRLVSRRLAYAGFPALIRHIGVLNTLESFRRLRDLELSPWGLPGATRHLTIYHAKWPLTDSYEEWHRHPLFFSSWNHSPVKRVISRGARLGRPVSAVQQAFKQYLQFTLYR